MPLFVVYGRAAPWVSEEFARVSASIRHGGSLPGLLGGVSLARRLRVSSLRASPSLSSRAPTVAVWHVPIPGLADRGYDSPQYEDTADRVVLGGVSGRHRQAGVVGAAAPAATGVDPLRDRMDVAAQAPARDGERRSRALAWRRGDGRHLGGWPTTRAPRQPPTEGAKAALVLVAVEKRGDASGRIRMAALSDLKEATIHAFVKQHIAPGSTLYTDAYRVLIDCRRQGSGTWRGTKRPERVPTRCGVGRSAGGSRDREPATVADRHLSRRQQGAVAGLSRRVRVSTQPPPAADGGVSDGARVGQRSPAHTISPNSGRSRFD